jgi:dTDP-4-dehydrorhamnose reductase
VKPVASADLPQAARRPRNAALDCARLAGLGIRPPSWRPAMEQLVDELLDLSHPRQPAAAEVAQAA